MSTTPTGAPKISGTNEATPSNHPNSASSHSANLTNHPRKKRERDTNADAGKENQEAVRPTPAPPQGFTCTTCPTGRLPECCNCSTAVWVTISGTTDQIPNPSHLFVLCINGVEKKAGDTLILPLNNFLQPLSAGSVFTEAMVMEVGALSLMVQYEDEGRKTFERLSKSALQRLLGGTQNETMMIADLWNDILFQQSKVLDENVLVSHRNRDALSAIEAAKNEHCFSLVEEQYMKPNDTVYKTMTTLVDNLELPNAGTQIVMKSQMFYDCMYSFLTDS
jgi:hypothetical protein